MKVLRIIARLNTGGPARHVVLANEGLQASGDDTLLVYGSLDHGEGSLEHLVGTLPATKIGELGRPISPLGDFRVLVELVRLIAAESPDVVHTHTAKAGALGRVAAMIVNFRRPRARRSLIVHTFHGHVLSGYFSPAASTVMRLIEKALAKGTDRIVAISPALAGEIVNRHHVATAAQTDVIPLGLDLDPLLAISPGDSAIRRELAIPASDVVIGFVGRFVPVKNLPLLVDAFAAAQRRVPNLWLVLFGDGPTREPLRDRVRALDIERQVRFYGWTERLADLYRAVDICAISSVNEGTPVAVIEAMAAAKPVVATDVGGVRDVVDHDRTGLVVPSGDAGKMADAFVRLAQNGDERRRFGCAGREVARATYRKDRLVGDLRSLYARALPEKRGR